MGVPKSLDYKDFMSKSTSANPTTWDDMYRFFGNQGEITAALVKSLLYQPDTAYSMGAIVYSPNLPAGTIAKCTVAGTTGSTEPVWPAAGSAVNDGTVRWLVENSAGSNITVDATLDGISSNAIANKAVYAALNNKLDKNGTAAAATKATQDSYGNVIVTTYARKSDLRGYVKTINNQEPDTNGNINISTGGGGTGTNITVDTTLSSTSNNPIANKAVYAAVNNKLDKNGTAMYASRDSFGNIITDTYAKKSEVSGVVKSVNNIAPDSNGNVNISTSSGGGGGVSTSVANTWTAQQNFQRLKFNFESFATSRISGTYDSPATSVATYNVTGALTLDMSTLVGMISNGDASIFTAYIASNGSYALSITNAGTLKYAGRAADLAITASGLLLNIFLIKNTSGVVTSIAQATKLS